MALDFSTWCGFNFRRDNGTNWPGGETGNEVALTGLTQTTIYPTDPDKGWLVGPSSTNSSRAIDHRIYGFASATSGGSVFAINAPNATYDLRLAMSHATAAARTGVIVVDSVDSGFITLTAILGASGSASSNGGYVTSDLARVYLCTTAGTYTGDVTGTGSGIQAAGGGTARFRYIGDVVHIADSVSTVTATSIYDVDGTIRTEGAWPTGGGTDPVSKQITVQHGGLKFCKHPSATGMYLRHIGLLMHTTPLDAAELFDHSGNAIASPTFYTGQPPGKLLVKLSFPAGNTDNLSLGGTLAQYFQIVTVGTDDWLASLLPIPDGTTGDLQIIQTDSSVVITGSPYTTTFSTADSTLTLVSSQGKPTALTGVSKSALSFALISTECWLNHKTVRDVVDAAFDGWSGQTFTNDIAVANSTELGTAITTVNAAVGVGVWQRIRITGGTYAGRTWTSANYSQGGTGGLLVQGTGTHSITGQWDDSAGWQGVHFDNLTFDPGASGTGKGIRGNARAAMNHEVVITNCTFGNTANTVYSPILFATGKSLKVRDNDFIGFDNGIDAFGVRAVEIGRNAFTNLWADLIGVAVFEGNPAVGTGKGVLADDHVYLWNHDNRAYKCTNNWGGYTSNNNPHCDAIQVRLSVNPWASGAVVGAGEWRYNDNKYYQTAAGGTCGATPPTHTSGSVSDGAVTWTYKADFDTGPRLFMSYHGSRYHASSTTYSDLDDATVPPNGLFIAGLIGFFTDSGGLPTSISVFDNLCASRTSGSWPATSFVGTHYVEHNTFPGPGYVPDYANPGTVSGNPIMDEPRITGTKVLARKNIAGSIQSLGWDEDNLVVPWTTAADPNLELTGPFTQPNANNSIWGYSIDENASADAFASQLETTMTPLAANEGYGAVTQAPASAGGGARANAGLSLGLGLGL